LTRETRTKLLGRLLDIRQRNILRAPTASRLRHPSTTVGSTTSQTPNFFFRFRVFVFCLYLHQQLITTRTNNTRPIFIHFLCYIKLFALRLHIFCRHRQFSSTMTGKRPTAISYYWFVSSPYGYEDEDMECMLDTISDLWSQDFEVDGKIPEEQNEGKKM